MFVKIYLADRQRHHYRLNMSSSKLFSDTELAMDTEQYIVMQANLLGGEGTILANVAAEKMRKVLQHQRARLNAAARKPRPRRAGGLIVSAALGGDTA